MVTAPVTKRMIVKWKQYFADYAPSMLPNRKSGEEVDAYFRKKYSGQIYESEKFRSVVEENIMANKYFRDKLPQGMCPRIRTYFIGNVYVGIDISSGEFQVECEETDKAVPVYDDLFVYRGLDKMDLKNFVMVGQYIELRNCQKIRNCPEITFP